MLLLTSHNLDLGNTVAIPQDDTDLRWRGALLCELADLLLDLIRGSLEPRWCGAGVGDGRGADALAIAVHATHFGVSGVVVEIEGVGVLAMRCADLRFELVGSGGVEN